MSRADETTSLEHIETVCLSGFGVVDVLVANGDRVRLYVDGVTSDVRVDLDAIEARVVRDALSEALDVIWS